MGLGLLLAVTLAGAAPEVPLTTLVHANARLAGREQRPDDVLKLWLVHNAMVRQQGARFEHEEDFRSLVWAALGETGLCTDGVTRDDQGAGVWPVAMHNWLVRALLSSEPEERESPFEAFGVGLQEREVSLHDVLSPEELHSVTFYRTLCLEPWLRLLDPEKLELPDFKQRLPVAKLMRELLRDSRRTLSKQKVESLAAIDARLFDLDVAITELELREAREQDREERSVVRELGLSSATRRPFVIAPSGEQQAILKRSLTWTPAAWLSLSQDRRLALFARARKLSEDPAALQALELGIIDQLAERHAGAEVQSWLGWLELDTKPALRGVVTQGDRGQRLLSLDRPTGFRERAPLALHRGVSFLEVGEREEALRSFAYAIAYAPESRTSAEVLALARRWLSFVLSGHQATDPLLATLGGILPKREFKQVVEDLAWSAALTADAESYEACARASRDRSAFELRVGRLAPLAAGRTEVFAAELRQALVDEPSLALRFSRQVLDQLEGSDSSIRRRQIPTLRALLVELSRRGVAPPGSGQAKQVSEVLTRGQAMLDALGSEAVLSGPERAALALSPKGEAFAGNVRLAPSDALPWPFTAPEPHAPSVFMPLDITPVEWLDAQGATVMGFRVHE